MEIRAKPATAILAVTARGNDIFYFFPLSAFFNSARAMRCVLGFRHLFVNIEDGDFLRECLVFKWDVFFYEIMIRFLFVVYFETFPGFVSLFCSLTSYQIFKLNLPTAVCQAISVLIIYEFT